MNLGILNCDRLSEEFAVRYGQYPEMFAALLQPADPQMTFTVFDALQSQLPTDVDAADAYLITGSRHGVNDEYSWIAQLESFVRTLYTAQKKVIGICFGHQLIAKALGGQVVKSPNGWGVGISQNHVVRHKAWMQPQKNKLNLLVSHQDQVIILPKDAQCLASSDFCPNYMMQIGSTLLSVQGHPEFTKAYAKDLMQSREDIIAPDVLTRGIQSLVLEHEHLLMAQWIVRFLHRK
jgi:GMP synthase-like glutamine amidotransferase